MNNILPKSDKKNATVSLLLGAVLGICLSLTVYYVLSPHTSHEMLHDSHQASDDSDNTPLYWVAPMDPNFKRDKPGKSPMGMDLVPVFANQAQASAPGTISIDPVTIQNLGVKTTIIQPVSPVNTINTFGQVQYAQDKISSVHSRVAGWVEKLYTRNQDAMIKQGDPLYELYSPELVNAQEEFVIALEQNNQALINGAQARLLSLNAPLALVNSLRKQRQVSRTMTFYAPQSGVINKLNIQEGTYVTPNKIMLSIASVDTVWILADIFTFDMPKIATGQSASIKYDALPGLITQAQIDYIYPDLDAMKRTVTARFVVPNPNGLLKPQMYADVMIGNNNASITSDSNDELVNSKIIMVPHQAVIRTGQQDRVVLALGAGRYKSIAVVLGERYDFGFAILEGLKEGDEVVISAQFLLDSESSISSNFMRMDAPTQAPSHVSMHESEITSAWTHATVNDVMVSERVVNLTHGPLDAFNMMGMTMNFTVAAEIDMQQFQVGEQVHVEIVEGLSGMYQINTVHFTGDMDGMGGMDDMDSEHDQGEQQ